MNAAVGPTSTELPWVRLHQVGLLLGRVQALTGIDLSIHAGECVAVLGANGGGKSSLLRVINGVCPPQQGRVERAAQVQQALVFQRPHMLRSTVLHNVCLGLLWQGVPPAQAQARGLQALERVGLGALAQRSAKALSGGQQQRVGLARALALEPHALLLDEPTANLDPHGKHDVEQLMAQCSAQGMSLVFASHNLGQVKRLATRVLYLQGGHLLADLPASEFFNPQRLHDLSPAAADFVQGE